MAKKYTIGLNYFFDNQSNSGIVNYIYNIIAALKTLEIEQQPKLIVFFSENAPIDYIKSLAYPDIEFMLFKPYAANYFLRKANALFRKLLKTDIYIKLRYHQKIDALYPYFEFKDIAFSQFKNKVHWLVDFNNLAFPAYYDDGGISLKTVQEKIVSSGERVVLSSNTLLHEMKQYFPHYNCDVRILRFASSLPVLKEQSVKLATHKHGINTGYLMSPNQFWEHKNQSIVLDALSVIKQQRPELKFKILFSGSLEVSRGKGYYIELLRNKVNEYALEEYISFLGVLEREEQLLLMKGCVALLQPSLYEGWSTLVEEAKALNKFIILSDLPVHREQISQNVSFFDPFNAIGLANQIIEQLDNPAAITFFDYNENIKRYGLDILKALAV